jgi:hypothetical protein
MPDININITPDGETKIADDFGEAPGNDFGETPVANEPAAPSEEYGFMDGGEEKDEFDLGNGFGEEVVEPETFIEEIDPEKQLFKEYLVSLRESLKSVLEAEGSYKKLNLSSMFPEGEVGTGVYMLTVAEIRDRLQKSSGLLSDIFNSFASIGSDTGEADQEEGSNFFTDEGYQASVRSDSIGDLVDTYEEDDSSFNF